jgi:hypothetical protein
MDVIMSKDWHKFFRGGFACALHYTGNSDIYIGYIGFEKGHPFYGSRFQRVNGISISRINVKFDNDVLDAKWWMGFNEQSNYQKALDKLKMIADSIPKNTTKKDSSGGFRFL